MGQYHYLIAGLPDITLDDSKQVYSVYDFKQELDETLTKGDKNLLSLFFLKYDNQNLIYWLEDPETDFDERGTFSKEDFEELDALLKEGKKAPKKIPTYIVEFYKAYLEAEEQPVISWEDTLAGLYYAYAMKLGSEFFSQWFEMNLNIKNVLTAITCRKHDLDRNLYIIGTSDVADSLRNSNSRDFNVGDEIDYLPALLRIAEDVDLVMREKKIDILKWEWLDDNTIFNVFGIESVFAYLLKVEMIERWASLDKEIGENTFRELVGALKKDSNNALEEFKKNNKR